MAYAQSYLVPLTTGAAYLARVMAESPEEGKAAAIRAAELAGKAPAWDSAAAVPSWGQEEPGVFELAPAEAPAPASPIGHAEAAAIAADWGSYMRAGDPGAIFYTFPGDTSPAWDSAAAAWALAYCDSCLAIARANGEELDSDSCCPDCGRDYGDSEEEEPATGPGEACPECRQSESELAALRAYIVAGMGTAEEETEEEEPGGLGIALHRFRDKAGLAITGAEGPTLYLDSLAVRELARAAATLAADLERRAFQDSAFRPVTIRGAAA